MGNCSSNKSKRELRYKRIKSKGLCALKDHLKYELISSLPLKIKNTKISLIRNRKLINFNDLCYNKMIRSEKSSLKFTKLNLTNHNALLLSETLFKVKIMHLTSLNITLFSNSLQKQEVEPFSIALKFLTNLTILRLDLSDNYLSNNDLKIISNALSNLSLLRVLYLNLNNNTIGPEGVKYLCLTLAGLSDLNQLRIEIKSNILINESTFFLKDINQNSKKLLISF